MLIDTDNNEIVCQKVERNKAIFFAEGIPAMGYKAYTIVEASNKENASSIELSPEAAENKFFKLTLDEKGQIKSFFDKENNREVLKVGKVANALQAFEDKPMNFDNWDIDIFYEEKMWKVDDVQSIEVVERGAVRSALKIERKFSDSIIVQHMYVYNDIPRIDFKTYVDWKEHQVLLKTAFPIEINTNKATYEIQYGNVERPTHHNTSWDVARFEVAGQKWADLSEGDFGVSLLNDSKYGHDIKDGVMRLTLLKSGIEPNLTTDQEEHFFTYSIYPHGGDWREANTVQMAYMLNNPVETKFEDAHEGKLPKSLSMVKVDKDNVIVEVVKKAEDNDDIIVRMYECYNKRTKVSVEFFEDLKGVVECNLMERDLEEIAYDKNSFNFEIKPYEIKSFRLKVQ